MKGATCDNRAGSSFENEKSRKSTVEIFGRKFRKFFGQKNIVIEIIKLTYIYKIVYMYYMYYM